MGMIIGSVFRDTLCADFNGSNEYVYCDDPSFRSDTQGCLAFWYRPATVLGSAGFKSMFGFGNRSASNAMLTLGQRWSGSGTVSVPYRSNPIPDIVGRTTNAGGTNRAYGNHTFSAATWVLMIVQSNGSAWSFYVNGSSAGGTAWNGESNTGDWFGDIAGADMRLTFGSQWISNGPAQYSDHRHNEGMYFNRPLTGTEVTWLYNGGVPRNPLRYGFGSDLVSWWRFGDSRDDATTIYDEIGSNNLTLVNMDASNYVAP